MPTDARRRRRARTRRRATALRVASSALALALAARAVTWLRHPHRATSSANAAERAISSRAMRRDAEACKVDAPTRLAERAARDRLFGSGRRRAGALAALRGDGVALSTTTTRGREPRYGDALDRYGFFVASEPVLSEREADETRAHLLSLLRSADVYERDEGCLGKLADCRERFDLSLRLTTTVTRAVNKIVSKLKPALVDIFGDEDCELVELSALITCKGSPAQGVHSDAGGVKGDDRLVSVFVSLQDTPANLGPTHVFFNSPNAITEFDYYSALRMMRTVADELGNSTVALRDHGLGDIYIKQGVVSIPEDEGATEEELKFFDAHCRVDERDHTLAFYPPWESSPNARLVFGVAAATRQGAALVYDSRTQHRGGANTLGARVQLMFSFQTKRAFVSGSTFTMRRRYHRIERAPLTLMERATLTSLGHEYEKSESGVAWYLRIFGKIRLRDFPLRADITDQEREWVNADLVQNSDNKVDFDVDGLRGNVDEFATVKSN